MDNEIANLKKRNQALVELLNTRNNQLFNAFSMDYPELFVKPLPLELDELHKINIAFFEYLQELETMGKSKFYAG